MTRSIGVGEDGVVFTGRTLAKRSSLFRRATIGDEYPATLVVGELTAPKRAPSHSVFNVSIVRSGRAVPVCWNVSKPAGSSTKEKSSLKEADRASRTRRPAFVSELASYALSNVEGLPE